MDKIKSIITSKENQYTFLIFSISFVFVFFGLLKVLNISPVREVVEQSFVIFENDLMFFMLGFVEILLGIGIWIKAIRMYVSIIMILHLLGTIFTAILNPGLTFDPVTIVTVHGEFVAKNIVFIAVASYIAVHEHERQ